MKNIVIIPARLSSQRLPNKLIEKIGDRYLFQIVYENIHQCKFVDKVLIATDSNEIAKICENLNFNYLLTPDYFQSGTDRISWTYQQLNENYDLVINVQGDEPLLSSTDLDNFIDYLCNKQFDVATIITKIKNIEDISNPNTVKVVLNQKNEAMYFSRAPIPWKRNGMDNLDLNIDIYYKHIGVYAYKPSSLSNFAKLPQSDYEKIEKLEQLRLLQAGYTYLCYEILKDLMSVDTLEDLEKVRELFK